MATNVHEILSVYWAYHPIYYFARIFGLAPYALELTNKRARWRVTNLSLLYNIFFFIVLLMCLMPLFQHIQATIQTKKLDNLAMYADFSRRVGLAVICMICVTLSLANRHKTCKLMKKMNILDLDLTSRGMKLNHGEMRKENMTLVVVMCVLLSICATLDLVAVILLGDAHPYRFASILLFIVCYLTQVQFMGFVMILKRR